VFRIIVNFTNSLCFLGHYCETYKFMNEEVIYTIFTESLVECGMLCYLDKKCNGIKFTENEEKRCTTMLTFKYDFKTNCLIVYFHTF
jgi:hypothetical protein